MNPVLVTEVRDHVARVVLNRPDRHNAVSLESFAALADTADRLAGDRSVRAVVLTGAGDNFCSGIDTELFLPDGSAVDPGLMAPRKPSPANFFQRAAYAWRELPVPVICAVRGVAFGAGLQIALGADIRYAHPDARFSIMEIRWGLIPDMGLSATLRELLPGDRARELAYTGRVVDAAEAVVLGLVTGVVDDPADTALRTAQEIATRSPDAIRAIKRLFNRAWRLDDADVLALEAELQSDILGSPNQLEAVRANIEKRPPEFEDPS